MKIEKIHLSCQRKARLADWRLRIVRDDSPEKPSEHFSSVFAPVDQIKDWKEGQYPTFIADGECYGTSDSRLREYCSKDPADWTKDRVSRLCEEEKAMWRAWEDGDCFGVWLERWNDKLRQWDAYGSLWGAYGAGEVQSLVDQMASDDYYPGDNSCVLCCDEDCKYCFDVVSNDPKFEG